MGMTRREHRALLVVLAVLLVATAWIVAGDRSSASLQNSAPIGHVEHEPNGTVAPVDLADAVVAPMLGAARAAAPRQAPLWILPGLAAAIAALCVLRRQRLRPTLLARRALRRASLADRAPPLASVA